MAGLHDGQNGFHEATAWRAPGAEREFPPDHGRAQGALADVVGEFDALYLQERPQPVAMIVQRRAHPGQFGVAAEDAAQQQAVDLLADRLQQTLASSAGDGPITTTRPVVKEFLGGTHQVVPQALHLLIGMIDQSLKIAFEMGPAPLQSAHPPVHLGPVAVDHAVKGVGEQFLKYRGGPRGPQGKERVGVGDEGPQPRFGLRFLGRRLVDTQHRLGRQLCRQFLVGGPQGGRRLLLQFHHPARRARLVQDLFQEQRHAALALFEAPHEQRDEGDQLRTRLAGGHAGRQLAAGAGRATRTHQPMQLIFGHMRLDGGNLPDLMPQRLGVAASQPLAATTARRRLDGDHVLALLAGKQRPIVLGMPRLTTRFLAALVARRRRFGMGMLDTGRQRRIPRRLVQSRFQFSDLRQQNTDESLCLRRLPGNHVFGNQRRWRHTKDVADFRLRAKPNILLSPTPGRERLPTSLKVL